MVVRFIIVGVIILGILALAIWSTNQIFKKKKKSDLLYKKFKCLIEGTDTYKNCIDLKTMFIAECMEEGRGGRFTWKVDQAYISDFKELLSILNTKIDIYKFNEIKPKPINDDELFAKTEDWWRKHFAGCPKDATISPEIIQDYIDFAKSDIVKNYWITNLNK